MRLKMLPQERRFLRTVYFCNSAWNGQRSPENGRVRVLGIPPFPFCIAHVSAFGLDCDGNGTSCDYVFHCQTSHLWTPRCGAHSHLASLKSLTWKPLWRVKVPGETKEPKNPKKGWLTADTARQILAPIVKPAPQLNKRPLGTPRIAPQ